MTEKTGFYIDAKATDFDEKFAEITKNVIPELAAKGLFNAANELLRDAIVEAPQAPKDKGDLWGSRMVIIPQIAGSQQGKAGIKVETKQSTGRDIDVEAGFNSVYATRQHEAEPGEFNYTTTKGASRPGPKFLESKMARNKNKYMKITADTIKAGGK